MLLETQFLYYNGVKVFKGMEIWIPDKTNDIHAFGSYWTVLDIHSEETICTILITKNISTTVNGARGLIDSLKLPYPPYEELLRPFDKMNNERSFFLGHPKNILYSSVVQFYPNIVKIWNATLVITPEYADCYNMKEYLGLSDDVDVIARSYSIAMNSKSSHGVFTHYFSAYNGFNEFYYKKELSNVMRELEALPPTDVFPGGSAYNSAKNSFDDMYSIMHDPSADRDRP